jgi:hypothetical protein
MWVSPERGEAGVNWLITRSVGVASRKKAKLKQDWLGRTASAPALRPYSGEMVSVTVPV